jgi:hypothetical protein
MPNLHMGKSTIFTYPHERRRREILRSPAATFYIISFLVAEQNNPLGLFDELKRNKNIKVHARKSCLPDDVIKGSFTKKKTVSKYRRSFPRWRWKDYAVIDPEADTVYQKRTFLVYQP